MANRERSNLSERGRHTRSRILAAASTLFARHGFDGTTVRMIAESCDMTDPALYYHFRSKREIHDALLVQPPETPWNSAGAGREQVVAEIVRRFFESAQNPDLLRILLRDALGRGKASSDFRDVSQARYRADLGAAFQRLFGSDANAVADAVYVTLSGLMWDALLTYGPAFEAVASDAFFQERVRAVVELAFPAQLMEAE